MEIFSSLKQTVYQLVCGNQVTAVITQTGELFIWGSNVNGLIVKFMKSWSNNPVKVKLPGPVQQIAFGRGHAMVRLADGKIFMLGEK